MAASALIQPDIHAPVIVKPQLYALYVKENTRLDVHVQHDGEHRGRTVHHLCIETNDDAFAVPHVRVVAPCEPYTHPSEEPNDNSFAARALRMARVSLPLSLSLWQVWACTYVLFTLWPDQEHFVLEADGCAWRKPLLASGLAFPHPDHIQQQDWLHNGTLVVSRAAFWQGAGPGGPHVWVPFMETNAAFPMVQASYKCAPQGLAAAPLHPFRPPASDVTQPLYRRYVPEVGQTLSFRCARSNCDADVDLLHTWHATDRVNTGWRQNMPREDHKKYLEDLEASSAHIPLIAEWNGEAFGYMEIYYAKETSLRTYYDAGDFDRGFHALVGEEKFRGPHRVRSWMGSLIHMLFLLDPRTMRVVSEPRASNTKMVEYECLCGGHVEKLIDFPHKRAALVFIPRERFFQLCPLGPLPGRT